MRSIVVGLIAVIGAIGFGLVVDSLNGWMLPRWQVNSFFVVMLLVYFLLLIVLMSKATNPRR